MRTGSGIWTVEEARAADRQAVEIGLSHAALMGVAGFQVARFVRAEMPRGAVVVVAGPGSNGGDGWVAAQHLAHDRPVSVIPAAAPRFAGADGWVKAARVAGVEVVTGQQAESALDQAAVVVDALFGTGFRGRVSDRSSGEWLDQLARRHVPVLAVDVPSGVNADTGAYDGPPVPWSAVLTMGQAKWGLLGYPAAGLVDQVTVADIGLPVQTGSASSGCWVTPERAQNWFPESGRLDHKYRRGRVLVVGGCRSMPGAPVMAALAALKAGAGLVELVLPGSARGRVALAPTLIVHDGEESASGSLRWGPVLQQRVAAADAIVFGPGLGPEGDAHLLDGLIASGKPVVLDADGIRLLARLGRRVPDHWGLTPHAAELGALLGQPASAVNADRRQALTQAAQQVGGTILLKGRFTLVAARDVMWANPTGDSSLATAGSGDVLAGIAGRLLAAGLETGKALALAAYWHGWAGELGGAAEGLITAADLVDWIGPAAQEVRDARPPHSVRWWS